MATDQLWGCRQRVAGSPALVCIARRRRPSRPGRDRSGRMLRHQAIPHEGCNQDSWRSRLLRKPAAVAWETAPGRSGDRARRRRPTGDVPRSRTCVGNAGFCLKPRSIDVAANVAIDRSSATWSQAMTARYGPAHERTRRTSEPLLNSAFVANEASSCGTRRPVTQPRDRHRCCFASTGSCSRCSRPGACLDSAAARHAIAG